MAGPGGLLLLGVLFAGTGCYFGGQRATQVARRAPTMPEMAPAESGVSLSASYYEATGGTTYGRFDAFGGVGMSIGPKANQAPGPMPEGTAALPAIRLHVGVGVHAFQIDRLRVGFFGLYASDGVSLLFERDDDVDTVATYAESSREFGVQLSLEAWRDDESYGEPFMRLAIASQTAYANSDRYQSIDGNPQFDATGIMATVGFNVGFVTESD